jgi:RimJ/RimL family protein N-acetyltransferase
VRPVEFGEPGGPTATVRIRTDRLDLVPLVPADAIEMTGVLADPSLYRYIGGRPLTRAELEATYDRWVAGSPTPGQAWHNWVIRDSDGGAAIGHLQASVMDDGRSADIAWVVGSAWQGRGYATEAAAALVDWLTRTGVATITAHVHPDNVASARVAERAGLERTDELVDGEVVWRRAAPEDRR